MSDLGFINKKTAALAPMAGVSVSALRSLCMRFGAAYCVSEMVSAKALVMRDKKTVFLLQHSESELPMGVQLFGSDPETIAKAARIVAENGDFAFIDINMGCPAPKIVKSGAGSALMKSPQLAADIVAQTSAAVSLPVTVKMRSGFESDTAEEFALLMQQAGAKALTLHPRTREQMFSGAADLSVLARVKGAVSIPVIGNGDITDGKSAQNMLETTRCDAVMVGRTAMGNPFVFAEIAAALSGGQYTPPTVGMRLQAMTEQVEVMCRQMGEQHAMLEARKHAMWYMRGFRGAAALRTQAAQLSTLGQFYDFVQTVRCAQSDD